MRLLSHLIDCKTCGGCGCNRATAPLLFTSTRLLRHRLHVAIEEALAVFYNSRFNFRFTKHHVRIIEGLRDADCGLRGFVFADPDGTHLTWRAERGLWRL